VTYHQNSDEGQRFCRMIPILILIQGSIGSA